MRQLSKLQTQVGNLRRGRVGTSDARYLGNNQTPLLTFPKKILLIDHEPGVTRLVRQALEKAGKYLVQEENDDRLALQAARSFQPDLILLDTLRPASTAKFSNGDFKQTPYCATRHYFG